MYDLLPNRLRGLSDRTVDLVILESASEALYNEMTSPAPFVAHPAVNIALLEFVDESYTGKLAYLIR